MEAAVQPRGRRFMESYAVANQSDSRSQSLLLFSGVAVAAACLWGVYAWRATLAPPVPPTQVASNTDAAVKVTPLRATRPIPEIIQKIEAENAAQQSAQPGAVDAVHPDALASQAAMSSVRANAPPSLAQPLELAFHPALHRLETDAPTPQQPTPSAASTGSNLERGRSALARGDLISARIALTGALDHGLPANEENWIRTELSRLSNAVLFSRATNLNDPLTASYTISTGDTLHAIAARHKITDELLANVNKITEPNRLQVGRRIKVLHGPFRIVIDKGDHRMDIYLADTFIRSFPCGLGTNGNTPTGVWVVNNKLTNPDWIDPATNRHYPADDPDNPIGERWIGLRGVGGEALGKTGFGIHGTIDPASVGQNKSMGCIRLSTEDVNFVYDLVVLNHSQVVIRP